MLKESEWLTINNVLLELYAQENLEQLTNKLMRIIRILIPYTKGFLLLLDAEEHVDRENSVFFGMSDEEIRRYLHTFYEKDYMRYVSDMAQETTVYRDTDIINNNIRQKTEFYQSFLKQADIPYGCGLMIQHGGKKIAAFSLFRKAQLGNFTQQNIEVLSVLRKHIENMLSRAMAPARAQDFEIQVASFAEAYHLTKREREVLTLMTKGLSNQEICQTLVVSLSTIKKHIYNLFSKTKVNSRTQLLHLLMQGRCTKVEDGATFAAKEAI
ncbi:response regulator transcription factor [Selenomonas bovis]|uniref:Response regulator transcription factor n=1 Tax=Selenomonas bovis TaxID=416586 RepID=A0A848BDJ4_9FIRM|nr:LuxR C-terminal-related transcriptional regulator [Selenomonas bovis]NMD99297.1 response regulator transcription factor [Selenomonas bovis]